MSEEIQNPGAELNGAELTNVSGGAEKTPLEPHETSKAEGAKLPNVPGETVQSDRFM